MITAVLRLAKVFLAELPDGERVAGSEEELETALLQLAADGRAAHPNLRIADVDVASYLARHLEEGDAATALARRNAADTYLACALARGDENAVKTFATVHEPELRATVARVVKDADLAADVVATVREKLLVGLDERGPRISDYGGHGDLKVWLRVIAIRTALTQLRTYRREVPADDQLYALATPGNDPELASLRRDATDKIKAAFHAGLAQLTPRQRNLLRQHLLDGLTIDDLGAIYHVHRVTAARWLTAARADLWAHTRRELRRSLELADESIANLIAELRSSLDLSIERALVRS